MPNKIIILDSKENGEIDIFEILGREPNNLYYTWHKWDSNVNDEAQVVDTKQDLSVAYHTYGFEWTPTSMSVYLDGKLLKTMNKSPDYPMLTLLGLYEKRAGSWTGAFDSSIPYPKSFDIDYWRTYQKIPTSPYTLNVADFPLYGQTHVVTTVDKTRIASMPSDKQSVINYDQLYSPDNNTHSLTLSYLPTTKDQNLSYHINGGDVKTVTLLANQSQVKLSADLKQGCNDIEFINSSSDTIQLNNLTIS